MVTAGGWYPVVGLPNSPAEVLLANVEPDDPSLPRESQWLPAALAALAAATAGPDPHTPWLSDLRQDHDRVIRTLAHLPTGALVEVTLMPEFYEYFSEEEPEGFGSIVATEIEEELHTGAPAGARVAFRAYGDVAWSPDPSTWPTPPSGNGRDWVDDERLPEVGVLGAGTRA